MADDWPYPLLSRDIDARHRARQMSSSRPSGLSVFITRTCPMWGVDERWVPRLEGIMITW
uniref:Uncharacterized protein n=1 Tax=Oryza barthii TaxID=65489 RepID=A0A0D3HUA0_9ORYZ